MQNVHILGKILKEDFFIMFYKHFQRQSIFYFPTKTLLNHQLQHYVCKPTCD